MKITKNEIEKLGTLSKIENQESEVEQLRQKLEAVLSYASGLAKIPTKITSTYTNESINVVRQDEVISYDANIILAQAPQVSDNFIVVPKIVK